MKHIGLTQVRKVIQTLQTQFGVYDLQFVPNSSLIVGRSDVFAISTSTGAIALYYLSSDDENGNTLGHPKIIHIRTIQLFPTDVLITFLAFHPEGRHVAMTLSDGQVCVAAFEPEASSTVPVLQHDFQAWMCSFVKYDGGECEQWGLISGGDDAILRYIDLDIDQERYVSRTVNIIDALNLSQYFCKPNTANNALDGSKDSPSGSHSRLAHLANTCKFHPDFPHRSKQCLISHSIPMLRHPC